MNRLVVAAVAVPTVVLAGVGVADHARLRADVEKGRRADAAYERRLADAEARVEVAERAAGDDGKVDALAARVAAVEKASKALCPTSQVTSERARLEGANAGSRYESDTYYRGLIGIIDAICGSPTP